MNFYSAPFFFPFLYTDILFNLDNKAKLFYDMLFIALIVRQNI
jgi:hypothetical protein